MKSILIFLDYYEPGYKAGGPIRSISGFVNNFKDNFKIYLVTRDRDLNSNTTYASIETDKWLNYSKNVSLMYLTSGQHIKKITKILTEDTYDWIYLNSFFSFGYSILPYILSKFKKINQGKFLIAPRGELNAERLNVKPFKKKTFISIVKFLNFYGDVYWHATSTTEKQSISKVFPNSKFLIAPNLAKISNFKPKHAKEKKSLKIIFISRIVPYKNLHFAIDVVNKMQFSNNVVFHFFGPVQDKDYFKKCIEITKKSSIEIEYKGELNHYEVSQTLLNYDVFLFPTLGENYGHVIAEALISGCIVLTSNQTPWSDLEVYDAGWSFPLDNKNHFVDRLEKLYLMDNENFSSKQKSVKKYVNTRINTEKTINAYFDFFLSNC